MVVARPTGRMTFHRKIAKPYASTFSTLSQTFYYHAELISGQPPSLPDGLNGKIIHKAIAVYQKVKNSFVAQKYRTKYIKVEIKKILQIC